MLAIEKTKKAFQTKLFLIFEIGKVMSSSVLFIIFYGIVQDSRLDYMYNLNILLIVTGLLAIFSFKLFDKNLRYVHYLSLLTNYGLFMFFLVLAKNPYSTIFFWLISGLTLTFYMTNVYFSAFITLAVISFIANWPGRFVESSQLKYELFANGAFQNAFNISLCLLIIFLFLLTYISERSRTKIYEDLLALTAIADSERSFPIHNPYPVFEYLGDGELISRNLFAEEFVAEASGNEIEILSNYAQTVLKDNEKHVFQLFLTSKHFLVNVIPVGQKVNIYFTDITELIKTQENLSVKEMENNAIIDAIPGFVSWIDSDLNYLGVNSQFTQFFNKDKTDFIGRGLGTVETLENNAFRTIVANLMADSTRVSMTQEINYRNDNKEYWNFLKINKYNDGNKAVLVSTDITELKLAQNKLIQEQQKNLVTERLAAFGEMSAGIAHEINNPLAVINVSIQRLTTLKDKDKLTDENFRQMIKTSLYGVDRIQKIISGLKNLSRDGNEDEFESTSLIDIVDDATVLLPQKCNHLNIKLDLKVPEGINLTCQRVQISQVIVILINNAIDAIEESRETNNTRDDEKWIRVDVYESKFYVMISIMDNGQGLAGDIKDKIFNPFFTTKGVGKGTGLGLSLAQRIIKSHKGSIILDEESLNTKFVISLKKNILKNS